MLWKCPNEARKHKGQWCAYVCALFKDFRGYTGVFGVNLWLDNNSDNNSKTSRIHPNTMWGAQIKKVRKATPPYFMCCTFSGCFDVCACLDGGQSFKSHSGKTCSCFLMSKPRKVTDSSETFWILSKCCYFSGLHHFQAFLGEFSIFSWIRDDSGISWIPNQVLDLGWLPYPVCPSVLVGCPPWGPL